MIFYMENRVKVSTTLSQCQIQFHMIDHKIFVKNFQLIMLGCWNKPVEVFKHFSLKIIKLYKKLRSFFDCQIEISAQIF
jgi:hypothetical protein